MPSTLHRPVSSKTPAALVIWLSLIQDRLPILSLNPHEYSYQQFKLPRHSIILTEFDPRILLLLLLPLEISVSSDMWTPQLGMHSTWASHTMYDVEACTIKKKIHQNPAFLDVRPTPPEE